MSTAASTQIIEAHGIKTIITTLPNGKRVYRTVLPVAKNHGAAGTPHLARIARGK
jgi:hypothetical protein